MAAYEYVAVTNIPSNFHTADLRAHFSSLVESRSFLCFHFRHRPEKVNYNGSEVQKQTDRKRCCVVKVVKTKLQAMLHYNDQHWTDVNGEILADICHISPVRLKSSSDSECEGESVEEEKLLQMPELKPPELMPNGNVGTPTLVFLDYIQQCLLPHSLVNKLQLKFPGTSAKRLYGNVNFDYRTPDESNISKSDGNSVKLFKRLHGKVNSDYGIPDRDNVSEGDGNNVKHFKRSKKSLLSQGTFSIHRGGDKTQTLDSSSDNSCQQSGTGKDACDKLLNNLALQKEPGNVTISQPSASHTDDSRESFQCSNVEDVRDKNEVSTISESYDLSPPAAANVTHKSDSKIFSAAELSQNMHPDRDVFLEPKLRPSGPTVKESKQLNNRERKKKEKEEKRQRRKLMAEGIEERLIAIEKRYHNDDDAEEWDRHEASEDDPSNQERNKERLYDEEIEQPWEKGGPGVVFYTDAMYWQEKEGDFDEQTTDDLDVDFSAYEEPGAGDKDIKDFLKIRQERRFRSGYDKTDRFSIGIGKRQQSFKDKSSSTGAGTSSGSASRIGAFERFSKGIGRKVMEKQGWSDGQGLGSSRPGIIEALKGEGQRPHNKRGLGYVDEEPVTYAPGRLKKRKNQPHLITTIYDDPKNTDPKEPLLQRSEPSTLKHRQSHIEKFS